jgi:aldehyde dehydrogenase (NAD+)
MSTRYSAREYEDDEDYRPVNRQRLETGAKARRSAGSNGNNGHNGNFQTKLFIDGQFVNSQSGKTFATMNPATGEELCQVSEADKADVDIAVRAARRVFETEWKFTNGSKRRDLMLKLADLIERNKEELATLETLDNGKPFSESLNVDLHLCIQCFRYYAGWADKLAGKTCPVDGDFMSIAKHEPLGVVGQIIPWNFPLLMATWKLAPALAVGCTIILKPAEQTPLTALRLAELINEAGYPAGVVNVLPGFGPTAGAAIAGHHDIDKVAFTGSTEVGKIIQETAAKSNLKRCSLELGGKSPLIICEDADLEKAVAAAQVGVFFNQGQVCTASSRIYVHERVYDEFVERLVAATKKRSQGNGFKNVNMGPQVSAEQQATVWKYIQCGKREGADCVAGGKPVESEGYFIQPTIFTNVRDDMTIAREEIFGPVMSVMKFRTLDEAIKRANKSNYGLAAGIFSRDVDTIFKYANLVKAGTVWVNTYNSFDAAQPFGGFKQSGTGRELGEYALELYTEVKAIMIKLDHTPVK